MPPSSAQSKAFRAKKRDQTGSFIKQQPQQHTCAALPQTQQPKSQSFGLPPEFDDCEDVDNFGDFVYSDYDDDPHDFNYEPENRMVQEYLPGQSERSIRRQRQAQRALTDAGVANNKNLLICWKPVDASVLIEAPNEIFESRVYMPARLVEVNDSLQRFCGEIRNGKQFSAFADLNETALLRYRCLGQFFSQNVAGSTKQDAAAASARYVLGNSSANAARRVQRMANY